MAGAVSLMEGWATVKSVPLAVGSVCYDGKRMAEGPARAGSQGHISRQLFSYARMPYHRTAGTLGSRGGVNNLALVC